MKKYTATIAFILVLMSSQVSAQSNMIESITIESSWGGLGTPGKDRITINVKHDGSYVGGKLVSSALIGDLLSSIDSEELSTATLQNLGLTPEWLAENARKGIDEYAGGYFSGAIQTQKDLYFRSFTDLKFVEGLLPHILRGGWTDDYPRIKVEIKYKGAQRAIIETDNQPPYMLPWTIKRNGRTMTTYNAKISRAVAALLPKNFVNRDRVSGMWFARDLAQSVIRAIKSDWKILGAENKARDAVNHLTTKYELQSLDINATHGVDHGKEWIKGNGQENNLFAVLRRKEFPKGFAFRIIMPFRESRVENLEVFDLKIEKYRLAVMRVGWLAEMIQAGRNDVWLRFVRDRSFSEKAMQQFAADMKILGKEWLLPEIETTQDDIALISVGGGLDYDQAYWLVLPDQRVVLWRFGYLPVVSVEVDKLNSKQCSSYHSGRVKCVGAIFSKNGELIK